MRLKNKFLSGLKPDKYNKFISLLIFLGNFCKDKCQLKPSLWAAIQIGLIGGISFFLSGCSFFSYFSPGHEEESFTRKATVIKTACSQIGKSYCSGGDSPKKGFDCSGLVWWSYRQHGIKIPRITVDQAKIGKAVARNQARAGDIVVFQTSNSPNGLHTGLYYGKDKFVHSPSRGKKVCLEKLASGWWANRLVAIRRVSP